jgi:hypothetical protein
MLDIRSCHAINVAGLGNRLGALELIMIVVSIASYTDTHHIFVIRDM